MQVAATYENRKKELEEYFDRTAVSAWAKLTSDAPVNRIRATVRAGRDRMRATLLSYLPEDMAGHRLLDAGCGTGSLAVEAARRGAEVVAIDISPTLIALAQERMPKQIGLGTIEFRVSDMLDPSLGTFDWVVAMDSLIHYEPEDMGLMVSTLFKRARRGMAFTYAPSTPLLELMHLFGRAFPRGNRAPDIAPIATGALEHLLTAHEAMPPFKVGRCERIDSTFYMSQAMELVRL
jgi:magnesium-protoporphyrin O-methyltransferase